MRSNPDPKRLSSSQQGGRASCRPGYRNALGLYNPHKKEIGKIAIGGLSILFISGLYTSGLNFPIHRHSLFEIFSIWVFPLVGTVFGSELDNPRFAVFLRSSTEKGDHAAGREHQDKVLSRTAKNDDWEIVEKISVVESGSSMDRDSLDHLLQLAKNDEIDGIAVMDVDRLTRAPVFEAIKYYQKLKQEDCLVYVSSLGYVDLDDLTDQQQFVTQTFIARTWYNRIRDGSAGAIASSLEEGRYPFGGSPFGYQTDDDNELSVISEEREFLYRCFRMYLRVKNRSEARRRLNKKRQDLGKEEISDAQLKTLLESKLCIGQFTHDGVVLRQDDDIRVVDDETYWRVQEVLRERRNTKNRPDLPEEPFERAIDRYGFDFVYSILECYKCCRKCGEGELKPAGSATTHGFILQSYECTNCGHQGPLLSQQDIEKLHQACPLRCPFCPATERFEVTKIDGFNEYQYTCKLCGNSFKNSSPPHSLRRGLEYPDERFDITSPYSEPSTASANSDEEDNRTTTDDQSSLSRF